MDLWDSLTRRKLVKGSLRAAVCAMLPRAAAAAEWLRLASAPNDPEVNGVDPSVRPSAGDEPPRALSFYNLHTGESLTTVYFENGEYVPGALREVNYFFRDFRNNEVKPIEPRLLDLLHRIHQALNTTAPFNLISGYRSPATNAWLASRSAGVSHHSMHMEGRAADINVQGRDLTLVESVALAMRGGGVGYYPRSDFVHVDTGRVRRW